MTAVVGVAVMAYGTPASPTDLEAYYTHIRRGRPPSDDQLADLRRRYDAIGGTSPLLARTEAQRGVIQVALEDRAPDGFVVVLGMRHAPPFIEDAIAALAQQEVEAIVGVVLAPHFSAASVGQYHERAGAAAFARGVDYCGIESWHDEPALVGFHAAAIGQTRRPLPPATHVLFTAHSLPERALADDPYPGQLHAGAAAIAAGADLAPERWSVAWQSASPTPEKWRGPDVNVVIRELAEQGTEAVLVCPHGFVADHLEVLYDLDVVAATTAADVGLTFARTASINDDRAVLTALAARIAGAAPGP